MAKGKGLKGQKWDKVNQKWFYPEGVTPAEPKETKAVKTEGVSMADVERLLAEQRQQIMADMASKEPIRLTESERNTALPKESVPESDLLDKPNHYYAWGRWLLIDAYKDRGRDIMPPYNRPIEFKSMPPQVEIDANGKRKELHWCSVTVWSKKIDEFIKTYPFFVAGIIMVSADDLKYEDARRASLKMQVIADVQKLNKVEVIEMCKGRHIAQSNDFVGMRNQLIESLCKDVQGNMRKLQENAVRRSNAELLK